MPTVKRNGMIFKIFSVPNAASINLAFPYPTKPDICSKEAHQVVIGQVGDDVKVLPKWSIGSIPSLTIHAGEVDEIEF